MNTDNEEELFSEDPEEQLNIENDILKLKLKAELGGEFEMDSNLPPEIENAFLKNVIEFEHQFANTKPQKIKDILGNPYFQKAEQLNDIEIENALAYAENLLLEKDMEVDYKTDYSPRLKYKFIIEELFEQETHFFHVPNMTIHFVYEDFHPNHLLDLEECANEFYNNWMEQSFSELSTFIIFSLRKQEQIKLSSEEVIKKFNNIFESYLSFSNGFFFIDKIIFEVDEKDRVGFGKIKGNVSYEATLENGEILYFNDNYEFELLYDDYWSIKAIQWPGFVW